MRRENRRKRNEGNKVLLYMAGSVLLLIVISLVIGIMAFGNKAEEIGEESQFSTSKISDLVPNIINNQILGNTEIKEETENVENAEETSLEIGRTVNELESELENTVSNIKEEGKATKITSNQIKKEKKQETKTEEEAIPDPEQITDTGIEINESEVEIPVFVKPVEGEIIREFAKDKLIYSETLQEWITHNGIDIIADKTTIVKSSADGKVSSIKNDPRYGLTVVIDHGNGYKTIYANLLTAEFVTEGEAVKSGQTIGTVGNTATFEILDDAHLHFELMQNDEYLDPSIYIKL